MSLQELIKNRYSEDLTESDDIEELDLSGIATLPHLLPVDKEYMERFEGISSLCMSQMGLNSLENWPKLNSVYLLNLNRNKLRSGLLAIVKNMPHVAELELEYNQFASIDELKELEELPNLVLLTLQGNPITMRPNYREELFNLLPNLKTIDNYDREGRDCLQDLIEKEGDEGEMDERMAKLADEVSGEDGRDENCAVHEISLHLSVSCS